MSRTRALAPDACARLAKLLGMLGSDHAGERAAAGLKADEMLKREGLRWADVIQPRIPEPVEDDDEDDEPDWRAMANACAARSSLLSGRELSFVRTMTRWRGQPSAKQLDWLVSIHVRVGGRR